MHEARMKMMAKGWIDGQPIITESAWDALQVLFFTVIAFGRKSTRRVWFDTEKTSTSMTWTQSMPFVSRKRRKTRDFDAFSLYLCLRLKRKLKAQSREVLFSFPLWRTLYFLLSLVSRVLYLSSQYQSQRRARKSRSKSSGEVHDNRIFDPKFQTGESFLFLCYTFHRDHRVLLSFHSSSCIIFSVSFYLFCSRQDKMMIVITPGITQKIQSSENCIL